MATGFLSLEHLSSEYIIEKDWLFETHLNRLSSLKPLVIAATQGWGIQEYMKELGFQLAEKNPDIHICYMDMKPVNSIDSFLEQYTATLSQRFPDVASRIEINNSNLGALKLPELIARKKKIKIALFFANSHLFRRINNYDSFLTSLRLRLRNQKNCVFCFYGNNTPFFRAQIFHPGSLTGYGRPYELNHNQSNCRSNYIRKVFHDQGKSIGFQTSIKMSSMVENHPSYIKLLAWHALIRTQNTCTVSIAEKALDDLILHFDFHFYKIVEYLTTKQLSFLKAMVEENHKPYSQETREKYQLGSSSNVASIKQCLQKKEILNAGNRECGIADPIFNKWLRRHYFSHER
jgi:hypothetical protein